MGEGGQMEMEQISGDMSQAQKGTNPTRHLATTVQSPPRPPTVSRQTSFSGFKAADTPEDAARILDKSVQMLSDWASADQKELRQAVIQLNKALKKNGKALEETHSSQLASLAKMLLGATGSDFDPVSRLLLLEVIELRTMDWQPSPKVENYYKQKLAQLDYVPKDSPATKSTPANGHTTPSFQRSQSLNVHAAEYRPLSVVDRNSNTVPGAAEATRAALLLRQYFEDCKTGKDGGADCSAVVSLPGDAGQVTVGAKSKALAQVARAVLEEFFSKHEEEFKKSSAPTKLNNNSVVKSDLPAKVPVIRQPIIPSSNGAGDSVGFGNSPVRREKFARTSESEGSGGGDLSGSSRTEEETLGQDNKNVNAIRYSREKLLSAGMSNNFMANGAKAGGTDLPSGWLGDVLSTFPDIKRSADAQHNLPIKWEEAFASSIVEGYVIGMSDQGLYSVPASNKHNQGGLYSIRESNNNNNNNNGSTIINQKKKNFLEVLRPNAPIREWDDKAGEWVEKEAGRG